MEWVETTAKSVAAAKEAALDQLGVDESDAEFEVLEEPRPGLFGRLRGEARVRARVRPTRPRPKVERRNRNRTRTGETSRPSRSRRPSEGQAASASAESRPPGSAGDGQRRRKRRRRSRSGSRPVASTTPPKAGADRQEQANAGPRSSSAASTPAAPGPEAPGPATTGPVTSSEAQKGTDTMTDATVEQQAAIVQDFLEGLVDAFAVEASVSQVRIDDETIEVRVAGDDLGLLIGPKGQTLQAVQDLARTVVQRQAAGIHHGRVRIDVGGYRQRRREALERFARQVAEDVRAKGVQKALEPMNAADRKVVHDVVNEIDGVSTISEGEEPRRRVVILPASG